MNEDRKSTVKQLFTVEEFRGLADGKQFEEVVKELTERMHVLQSQAEAAFAKAFNYQIEDGKFRSSFEIVREAGQTTVEVSCTVCLQPWDDPETT